MSSLHSSDDPFVMLIKAEEEEASDLPKSGKIEDEKNEGLIETQSALDFKSYDACEMGIPSICNKSNRPSNKNGNLYGRRHKRIDPLQALMGDPPFKCSFCLKRFGDRKLLTKHYATHQTLQPFGNTNQLQSLQKMDTSTVELLRIHPSPQTYQCALCSIGFKDSVDLELHLQDYLERGDNVVKRSRHTVCRKAFSFQTGVASGLILVYR